MKQPTLQRIESGQRIDPSVRTIAALAIALDVTIESLLGDTPREPGAASYGLAAEAFEALARRVTEIEQRLEELRRAS